VFVSHRQVDDSKARRIAYLACNEGFEFWLDVLDPNLPGVGQNTPQSALATASIIEMALLNSTHLIAVMTVNTKGSQWVPYEYGRVKLPQVRSLQASCWADRTLPSSGLPEYLHLGAVLRSETEIRDWLRRQLLDYKGSEYSGLCHWSDPDPPVL
jgi:hypothetical protein